MNYKCIEGFCEWNIENYYEHNNNLDVECICNICGRKASGTIKIKTENGTEN